MKKVLTRDIMTREGIYMEIVSGISNDKQLKEWFEKYVLKNDISQPQYCRAC